MILYNMGRYTTIEIYQTCDCNCWKDFSFVVVVIISRNSIQNVFVEKKECRHKVWSFSGTIVLFLFVGFSVYQCFSVFFAAVKPSVNVCVAHGTSCDDPSVCIAVTAMNCVGEFRPRQFRPVSAEPPWQPLAEPRGSVEPPVEKHCSI